MPFCVLEQLCGATLSVQLNIAEGYALATTPQFRKHLNIAYGSVVEAEDLLITLLEEEVIPADLGTPALTECRRSKRALLGLIRKLRPH